MTEMTTSHLTQVLQDELDLSARIANLEERAAKLDQSFSAMNQAAREIADFLKRHVNKVETERKSWDIVESILQEDKSARDVLDHVKIFFNFLIAKMKARGVEITDVKMLWHLHLAEGVNQIWRESLCSFGFQSSDFDNLRLLLAVIYKLHTDIERNSPDDTEDTDNHRDYEREIAECIRFINSKMEQKPKDETSNLYSEQKNNTDIEIDENGNAGEVKSVSDVSTGSFGVHVDRKLLQGLALWKVDPSMKEVVKKIISIVVYTMNVGRDARIHRFTAHAMVPRDRMLEKPQRSASNSP